MSKLLSMVDFIMHHSENTPLEDYNQVNETFVNKVIAYANFLKQPLKLSMFVPCDDEGNVLIEPIEQNPIYWSKEYQQAKEKVLFEGFEIDRYEKMFINNKCVGVFIKNKFVFYSDCKTIESLIVFKPALTKSALDSLGLNKIDK